MLVNKPKFWTKKKSLFSVLLYPFSLIFKLITYFKKKNSSPTKFKYKLYVWVISISAVLEKHLPQYLLQKT